jgi:hypothetical protein
MTIVNKGGELREWQKTLTAEIAERNRRGREGEQTQLDKYTLLDDCWQGFAGSPQNQSRGALPNLY